MNSPPPQRRLARRIFKALAVLATVAVVALAALLGAMRLEHGSSTTLPAPTGPFAVGRAVEDWTDDKTLGTLAPVPGTKRELLVWIWYPAAGQAGTTHNYLPDTVRTAVEGSSGVLFSKLLTRDLSKVHGHSRQDADVSPQDPPYPVLIMRAGASAEVWNYSTLAEDLASHGYVVVGFDAPYRTHLVAFPDGRVLQRLPENNPELCEGMTGGEQDRCATRLLSAWTEDMAFVLDRLGQLNADKAGKFEGRLDMTRVGAFGHSFGGAAALQFCHDDERCKAVVDVDGAPHGSVIKTGVARPAMILLSDHRGEHDPKGPQIMADLQSIYDRAPTDGRVFLEIRGANHFLFSDDGALLKSHIVMRTLRMFGVVGIDGRRQLAVTSHCLQSFFDAELKGAQFGISFSTYPEIRAVQ
jgi:pimeloyl-ACP methyl ester carboxylesterase